MNLRLIGLGTGAVLAASTLGACGTYQQDPQCVVAKGAFATVYTLKEGQDATQECAQLKPERVGMEKYFSVDPSAPDSVTMRSRVVGELLVDPKYQVEPDAHQPHSLGALSTDAPGPDNFCEVPSLNPTQVVLRSTTGGANRSLTYAWSNLRVYNTPEIPGTQFTAELRYSENGCTAEYTVKGIWPVVSCGTGGKPDDSKCDPNPDPASGRYRGSGINPIFPVKCDPVALFCVLTGEVPSDKP
ncbi:hypothetical protein [Archangium lansingense]|uniref:Lipoprotein MlpA n=1 Tax=Archangium lansingense TaxID=2995310 RepID=A0ABT4A180_9BACT|nr:hypothetical protein [Archangium lansinium]MCY1075126.1 hypothetical protein [Archangium lansinium]